MMSQSGIGPRASSQPDGCVAREQRTAEPGKVRAGPQAEQGCVGPGLLASGRSPRTCRHRPRCSGRLRRGCRVFGRRCRRLDDAGHPAAEPDADVLVEKFAPGRGDCASILLRSAKREPRRRRGTGISQSALYASIPLDSSLRILCASAPLRQEIPGFGKFSEFLHCLLSWERSALKSSEPAWRSCQTAKPVFTAERPFTTC